MKAQNILKLKECVAMSNLTYQEYTKKFLNSDDSTVRLFAEAVEALNNKLNFLLEQVKETE